MVSGLRDEEVYAELRRHTRTARPLSDPGVVDRPETLLGRVLRPGERGPKPKKEGESKPEKARVRLS